MRILLIAGGWSGERDVALSGAAQIEKSLCQLGHNVTRFDPAHSLRGLREAAQNQDFAFINLHGSPGEDGLVQCLLERLNLPFQGSDSRASLLALNKAVSKQIFEEADLPTPAWEFIPASQVRTWQPSLPLPLVLKPNTGGSSLGVDMVATPDQLAASLARPEIAGQDILAETLIRGQELTCGVLEGHILPPILIRPKHCTFFDYASKYEPGATEEICPAPISPDLTARLQALALAAHKALGLSDYSRTDFMVSGEDVYLLEVNTLPGMTATSLVPQEALAVGLSFEQLLEHLIALGLRKKR